MRDTNQLLEE